MHLLVFLCLVCLLRLYLSNHSSRFHHSFVIACITWYLDNDSPVHICILSSFKWRQTIVYWARSVRKNQGKEVLRKVGKSWKIRQNKGTFFMVCRNLCFPEILILQFNSKSLLKESSSAVLTVRLAFLRYLKKMK